MATAELETRLPRRRQDLIIRPFIEPGAFVVKDPVSRKYFRMGEQEHFLLQSLDGEQTVDGLCAAFEARFNEPLSADDVEDFLKLARDRALLAGMKPPAPSTSDDGDDDEEADEPLAAAASGLGLPKAWQSPLFFRISLFDPDRLFNFLEPGLRFVWTRAFFWLSLSAIAAAAALVWTHRAEFASSFNIWGWQAWLTIWVTIILVTTLHEFAHGLTCKHYGGEVHELGVLMVFFTPCFYCNVSDSWLIPQKSRRLWITAAGAYWDLCMWAVAVFVWRLTIQDTFINYVASIVVGVCGTRGFINLNPFLRLDGYYLLSDALEIPNLRRRAYQYWMGWIRWALWGARRPEAPARARTLLVYGACMWSFGFFLVDCLYLGLCRYLGEYWGLLGVAGATLVCGMIFRALFRGFFAGEFNKMVTKRPLRSMIWIVGLVAAVLIAFLMPVDSRSSGSFHVRPARRVEVRAQVAGFLREVVSDEGQAVVQGARLLRLEVPDLESQLTQKAAELTEAKAQLRRLEAGPRPEEVHEQRLRVARIREWRDLAEQDLARARMALTEDLRRYDQQIAQARAELEYAHVSLAQADQLYRRGVMAGQQYLAERKRYEVAALQLEQTQAQKRAREAAGLLEAEAELARRAKDLADVEAVLRLLEAGSRPEDLEAERARVARLEEERKHLQSVAAKQVVACPLTGLVVTPRLHEKVGQFFDKGALICEIEDVSGLEAEIAMAEQDVTGVKPGQTCELKARALPFKTFQAKVDRVAPRASIADGKPQGTVTVYCHLEEQDAALLAGMTGVGRVKKGPSSLALIGTNKLLKYLRTEFWW